uniref:Ig-like domain-containing protein n=1 Tax=Sinocyclocheilus grahami TaxID=75366 RepID=A0A672RMI3_SINGR
MLKRFLTIYFTGSNGQVTATQTPQVLTSQRQSVTVTCTTSLNVGNWCNGKYCLSWYLKKPGDAPKLFIYQGDIRYSSTPSRFSGRGSGKTFQLIISEAQNEDSGEYYCFCDLGGNRFTQ